MATSLDTPITMTVRDLLLYTRKIEQEIRAEQPTTDSAKTANEAGPIIFNRGFNAGINHARDLVTSNLEHLVSVYEDGGSGAVVRLIHDQAQAAQR